MLIVGGSVVEPSGPVQRDVRFDGSTIGEVGTLRHRPREEVLDARGCLVVPGLWDHHVHLRAWAAVATSLDLASPSVIDRVSMVVALRRAAAQLPAGGWLRAIGYHDGVVGDLDRWALDAAVADRPVRVQHRSGALWVLNSAGLRRLGVAGGGGPTGLELGPDGLPTGRLWREDRWLAGRTAGDNDGWRARLAALATAAARRGVTGMTDATPGRTHHDAVELAALVAEGAMPQRLALMAPPELTGISLPAGDRVTLGPVKHLLDDSNLPDFDVVVSWFVAAHGAGRPVAIHAVTDVQLALVLAAAAAGGQRGDRVEHAAVVADTALAPLAASGLTVVTSPAMVAARGDDYFDAFPPGRRNELWRAATLAASGVALAAGSDAPHGPSDPWVAVAAASTRATSSGRVLGPADRVSPLTALTWWCGRPDAPSALRRIEVGAVADLAVVDEASLRSALPEVEVRATVIAGSVVHRT